MEEITKRKSLLYILSYYSNFPLVKPNFINFGLTHRCNLRCKICETWEAAPNIKEELTLSELKNVINQIAAWGDINISFAGGEPLVRKNDLIECIKHAKALGLTTHMTTNGIMINDKTSKEIVGSGLDYLQISLDGISKETNDHIRAPGSFDSAIRAIKHIKKDMRKTNSNLKLSLTTVVTNRNLDELLSLYEFVKSQDLHEVSYNPYTVDNSYMKNKDYEEDEFWVSEENIKKLRQICKKLIRLKKKENRIGTPLISLRLLPDYFEKKSEFNSGMCLAGYSYMYVKPNGDVDVCGKGPSSNVRDMNIRKIWYSLRFAKARFKIATCKKPCLMLCFPRISLRDIIP